MLKPLTICLLLILIQFPSFSQGETTEVNGIDLYYEVHGQGEPLLLLHGWTQSSQFWNDYISYFVLDFQVYSLDLRGHGQSTPLDKSFSIQQTADDLVKFMDEIGIESAHAIGFSFGGMTLLELVKNHPNRINKMVLVSTAYSYNGQDGPSYQYDDMPNDFKSYLASTHFHGEKQIRSLFNPKMDYQINLTKNELSKITAPTMIIAGDRDEIIGINQAVDMHQAMPNTSLFIAPDTGHMVIEAQAKPSFLIICNRFFSK